jgi:fido (protein-threonine AMPylation protein)
MKSVLQRFVAHYESLQNIHPFEDGSGQARFTRAFPFLRIDHTV